MHFVLICLVAFLGSGLTFFSGFGLGSILLPAYTLFFPVPVAVALTGIVHFLNNLFKLGLVGHRANRKILFAFGIPAAFAAVLGAWFLSRLSNLNPLFTYTLFDKGFQVEPVKLVIGILMVVFAAFEIVPALVSWTVDKRYLRVGGLLSGFFGGLSGHQGALRSAFLIRCGLSKEAFLGTGVAIACIIDLSRLTTYWAQLQHELIKSNLGLLAAASASAFSGAFLGNRLLHKITMAGIQKIVAVMLTLIGLLVAAGIL